MLVTPFLSGAPPPKKNPGSALEEYFYSPLDGMLVHHRATPSIKFASTIYTPGWRMNEEEFLNLT